MRRLGSSRRAMTIAIATGLSLLLVSGAAVWARNVYRDALISRHANPTGMVTVPGGRYMIGSRSPGPGETTLHARMVTIPTFAIDRFPAASDDIGHQGASRPPPRLNPVGASLAGYRFAHGVSYDAANRYCHALHKRLPSEVEWEVAARGFDQRSYPWGDAPPSPLRKAALLDESPFGVESMVTGVAEWTTPIILRVARDEAILHGNVDPNVGAQTLEPPAALSTASAPTTMATIARRVVVRKDGPRAVASAGVRCAADAMGRTSRSDAVVTVANHPTRGVSLVGRYLTDATLDTMLRLAPSHAATAVGRVSVRYGVAFRITAFGGYDFAIDTATSQWSLRRTDGGTTIELARGTPSSFGGWRAPDHLHVEMRGANFELFVNDEFVGHVVDRTFDIGDVGVLAATTDPANSTPPATVTATNLTVTER